MEKILSHKAYRSNQSISGSGWTIIQKYSTLISLLIIFGCNGKSRDRLYSEGVKELNRANHSGAVVFFKSALEKDPKYKEARYQLAKTYLALGKYELAEKEFKRLALQNPSTDDITLELAKIHIITKNTELAIQEIEKLEIKTAEAQETLGTAYALKNRFKDAEKYFLLALKTEPKRTSAKIKLAAIHKELGRNPDARRLLNEIIQTEPKNFRAYTMLADLEVEEGHKEKAINIYGKASLANPSDPAAPYKKGLLHIEKGDLEQAGIIASDLAKRFPKHAEGTRLLGLLKFQARNYSEAIHLLQSSIRIFPTQEAYFHIGLCHFSQENLELALSQFRKIIDVNPSALQARLLTGIILLKQKRVDDSIAETKNLLQISPRFALGHNILGSAYMAKGMYDEGIKELNRALELDPGIVDAHLKKGIFLFKKGRIHEAGIELQTAVQISPEILNTRLLLASYYIRLQNSERAVSVLKQGVTGKKGDAVLYTNLSAMMLASNKKAEGIAYLEEAKKADPDYLSAYFNLATVFSASDEQEKALNEYRAILQRSPDNLHALLNMAGLLEMKGRDDDAYRLYRQATATKAVEAYLALANYHVRKKETGKAHSVLESAIKQIPRNVEALEMQARLHIGEKNYRKALASYNDIYSFNPDLGINHRISLYLLMNEAPKALEETRRYITNKPYLAYGYLLQAAVHEKQGRLGLAIETLQKGIGAEPGNTRALVALGNMYAKNNDRKSAMNAFEKALEHDEEFLPALFAKAALIEAAGNRQTAVRKYREILSKSDRFMPALNNLAYIYIDDQKNGNLKEGLRLAFSGFRLAPENPAIMDTLGYALVKNGRGADAVKLLEKAKALLPDEPSVAAHLALAYAAKEAELLHGRKAS